MVMGQLKQCNVCEVLQHHLLYLGRHLRLAKKWINFCSYQDTLDWKLQYFQKSETNPNTKWVQRI